MFGTVNATTRLIDFAAQSERISLFPGMAAGA